MTLQPRAAIVVAAALNGTIGLNGQLPWHLPDDMKFFKATTTGGVVVMGRKTFEALGRPLPNRHNLVLSQQPGWQAPGTEAFTQLEAAAQRAAQLTFQVGRVEFFVIGGGQIYQQFLQAGLVYTTYLTRVLAEPPGDTFFHWPETSGDWNLTQSTPHPADERHAHAFRFETWERWR